jgi:uncharacterized protein YueI
MDGQFYSLLNKAFAIYGNLENDASTTVKESSGKVTVEALKIVREKDAELFLKEFAAQFAEPSPFTFEAASTDEEDRIIADEFTKVSLGQKLGLLIAKNDALNVQELVLEKDHEGITTLVQAYQETPSFGSSASPVEVTVFN